MLFDKGIKKVATSGAVRHGVTVSGATTGGNGGSRLRAPLERGRRVQTEMFFYILFNYKILSHFVAANDTALNTLRPIRPCFTANNNQLGL